MYSLQTEFSENYQYTFYNYPSPNFSMDYSEFSDHSKIPSEEYHNISTGHFGSHFKPIQMQQQTPSPNASFYSSEDKMRHEENHSDLNNQQWRSTSNEWCSLQMVNCEKEQLTGDERRRALDNDCFPKKKIQCKEGNI